MDAFIKDINGDWAAFSGSSDVNGLIDAK